MQIQRLSVEEVFRSLSSGPGGLAGREAARRLREYGPNAVAPVPGEPWWRRLSRCFTNFFALVLWVAAALAGFAEWREPGQGMLTLAVAIAGVVVLNGSFSFWQEFRAERTLLSLRKLLPNTVKAVRDGRVEAIPADALVPGDLILIEEGNLVPADCRLVEAAGVRVNNAILTGESVLHSRHADADETHPLSEARNVLLAGASLAAGQGRAVVFATGERTVFGGIASLSQVEPEELSPLQREIHRLSRVIAGIATGLGLVFFGIGQLAGLGFWHNFIFAIGIIVANVPEGLLPTVTLALAMASRRMARRQALIRHLPAIETLGCTTVICTDKTGTLTENRMSVRKVYTGGAIREPGELPAGASAVRAVALHCHDLKREFREGEMVWAGDPMEVALRAFGASGERDGGVAGSGRVGELPFDSARKRLTVLQKLPEGVFVLTKGAPETVLPLCDAEAVPGGEQPLTRERLASIVEVQNALAENGYRVLALATREAVASEAAGEWEHGLVFAGLVALEDPPRPEVKEAIRKCREASIRVVMITGDHPVTARAIARETGLDEEPVMITGERLNHLSDTLLQLALDDPAVHFARVGPGQKSRIVAALQRKGHVVAVTGDGVNDAPALRRADVGIAMGRGGTDVARESADMVLLDDHFATIVAAIEEGRAVYANLRKFLTYILTSNIPEVVPYLAFVLFRIPLPLTVIQILAVDLGTDILPALGLGAEKPHPGVLREPPRDRNQPLLSRGVLLRAYGFLGILEAAGAMAAFFFVLRTGGWEYPGDLAARDPLYLQATTACLATIVVMQVANVFACRSSRESAFSFALTSNRLLLWGVAVALAALALIGYTPWGNALFGAAPLPVAVWLFIAPFPVALLLLEEGRKRLVRARGRTGRTALGTSR